MCVCIFIAYGAEELDTQWCQKGKRNIRSIAWAICGASFLAPSPRGEEDAVTAALGRLARGDVSKWRIKAVFFPRGGDS